MFLFISGAEIGFIIFIVVLLFGADKIPEFAKGMAKGINNIKHATNEIKNEINNSKENLVKDSDISKNIDSEIKKVKSEMDSVSGTIKRDL
ncbi:twin-arginine translocase TatA/TatE family subunit [bacterium]|jgi:sec-independent protein translocase protein TatA|nr:twin-arginine translocase TatA/TatE family subunit [bacterium]|tara:strand:- start:2471 stop:2743 length:273 start_codon:yes stop_codon:yes gene_type:complete